LLSREGLASLVLKNGDSYLGRFKADQLDGLVQETISLCDRYIFNPQGYFLLQYVIGKKAGNFYTLNGTATKL
jgi:hypothetical protein